MKKPLKIILIILATIFLYLGIAFAMQDQGEFWCDMSNGNYQPVIDSRSCESFTEEIPEGCIKKGPEHVCSRGWFNIWGGQNTLNQNRVLAFINS